MRRCRLHITGASGTGTTTLGRALASAWSAPHADADDYYWVPTNPPYTTKRTISDRLRLMDEVFLGRDAWVLTGSLMGWGDPLIQHFDAVVFVSLDHETRMDRLRMREATRYGASIQPGGSRESAHREFMDWAAGYEDPDFTGRNRVRHEQWLHTLPCPVVSLNSAHTVDELIREIDAWQP